MRLTLHTDYALRVLVYVGSRADSLVTISEIADCFGISKNHLTKVVHQLGRDGVLGTVRGKHGGVRLLANPDELRLGDFLRRTEEDFDLARCLRPDDLECRLDAACIAKRALAEGLEAFFAALNRYTLADLLKGEGISPRSLLGF